MKVGSIYYDLDLDDKKFEQSSKRVKGALGGLKTSAGKHFSSMQDSVSALNSKLLNTAKWAAAGLGAAVIGLGKMGSDFKRLEIATETIAENMGYGAEQVKPKT